MEGCFDEMAATVFISTTIPKHPKVYGYMFINKGDTGVWVNQTYLKPYPPGRPDLSGESYSFVDPLKAIFTGNGFKVLFDAAPAADQRVEIHQYHKVE